VALEKFRGCSEPKEEDSADPLAPVLFTKGCALIIVIDPPLERAVPEDKANGFVESVGLVEKAREEIIPPSLE
jgi:hypothetical protein